MGDVIENGRGVTGMKKATLQKWHLNWNTGKKKEPTMQTGIVKNEGAALLANTMCLAPSFSCRLPHQTNPTCRQSLQSSAYCISFCKQSQQWPAQPQSDSYWGERGRWPQTPVQLQLQHCDGGRYLTGCQPWPPPKISHGATQRESPI